MPPKNLNFRNILTIFFQVFNAKKVHTYITVDDSTFGPSLSPSGSMQTLQTTAGYVNKIQVFNFTRFEIKNFNEFFLVIGLTILSFICPLVRPRRSELRLHPKFLHQGNIPMDLIVWVLMKNCKISEDFPELPVAIIYWFLHFFHSMNLFRKLIQVIIIEFFQHNV